MHKLEAFADAVVASTRGFVNGALAQTTKRLEALEKALQDFPVPKDGKDGKDADVEAILKMVNDLLTPFNSRALDVELVRSEIAQALAELPPPRDGQDANVEAITAGVLEKVAFLLDTIPVPEDGQDADPKLIEELVAKAVAALPAAATVAEVAEQVLKSIPQPTVINTTTVVSPEIVRAEVEKAIAVLPKPRDGKDADVEGIAALVLAKVPAPVPGKDADPAVIEAIVHRTIEALPKPQEIDPDSISAAVLSDVLKALDTVPLPRDGRDADPVLVRGFVREEVDRVFALLPVLKSAGDPVDMVKVAEQITNAVALAISALPKPADGRNADPAVIEAMVAKAVAALPPPRDGQDADVEALTKTVAEQITATLQTAEERILAQVLTKLPSTPALIAECVEAVVKQIPPPPPVDSALILGLVTEVVAAQPKPRDGRDVDPAAVEAMVAEAVASLPQPRDGKDVDVEEMQAQILEKVCAVLDTIPVPKDGRDGADISPDFVRAEIAKAVAELPPPSPGVNGKDAPPVDIAALKAEVLASIPVPKDGKDGASVDLVVVEELVSKAVTALPLPKDGKDGKDAEGIHPDTVALMVAKAVEEAVAKALAAIKMPKDGEPGRDAINIQILPAIDSRKTYPRGTVASWEGGLVQAARTTDKLEEGDLISDAGWVPVMRGISRQVVTQKEDLRTFEFATQYSDGTVDKTVFSLPVQLYRDIWKAGTYVLGDTVTYSGSNWHCQVASTEATPGLSKDWKLITKKGADGKDGKDGEKGEKGERGLRGYSGKDRS